jgi:hypothetical protein
LVVPNCGGFVLRHAVPAFQEHRGVALSVSVALISRQPVLLRRRHWILGDARAEVETPTVVVLPEMVSKTRGLLVILDRRGLVLGHASSAIETTPVGVEFPPTAAIGRTLDQANPCCYVLAHPKSGEVE